MWPFDWFSPSSLIDFGPVMNLALGVCLIFAGLFAFAYVPGKLFKVIVALSLLGCGIALAFGYVEVW